MITRRRMVTYSNIINNIYCDGCGVELWVRGDKSAKLWEAYYSGPETRLTELLEEKIPEDVQMCISCFSEALEYIRGKKEEERNNNLKNQAKPRKRFRSLGRNNSW